MKFMVYVYSKEHVIFLGLCDEQFINQEKGFASHDHVIFTYVVMLYSPLSFKASQLDAFCCRPYCTVILNSNLAILKT